MTYLIYESQHAKAELTTEHPASSYGMGVLLVTRKDDNSQQAYGPADMLPSGVTAGQLVKSFISNPPAAPAGYANFGKYTDEAGELARKFLSQLPPEPPVEVDVLIENHGTIFMVRPQTEKAKTWLEEHTGPDTQWFGEALAVEHGYVMQLAEGMQEAGLKVE